MKKNNLNLFTLSLISLFLLVSCSKSDSSDSNGTSTGNYFPLAVNNSWKYLDVDQSIINETKIIGTTTINGTTYYEYTDDSETITIQHWFAKKGAAYLIRSGDTTINENGITAILKAYELPILKDDYAVNDSWTGSVSPKFTYTGNGTSGTLPFKIDYTAVNFYKGEVTLNGISYPNVIKTRFNISINANGQITTGSEEYWFAENIGLIKDIYTSTDLNKNFEIDSYTLN